MDFLRVITPGEGQAGAIEVMRAAGNKFLPNRTFALNCAIHQPWWVSEDRTQVVFARWQGGAITSIVVFVVELGKRITQSTPGAAFSLAAGEGWMRDNNRADERTKHVHHALISVGILNPARAT